MDSKDNVSPRPGKRGHGHDAEKRIEASLKAIYDETLNEELPDRFKELIAELRKQDTHK